MLMWKRKETIHGTPEQSKPRNIAEKVSSDFRGGKATHGGKAMLIWKRKETIHGTQEQLNATSNLGNEKTLSLDTMPQIYSDRVIIPNHIRVPDAERVAIRFGSFDINFMQKLCLKIQADIDNGSDVAASKTQQEMNSDVGNAIFLSQPSLTLDNDKSSSAFKCAEELIENTPSPHIAYEIEEVVSSNHLESLEQREDLISTRREEQFFYIPTMPGRNISGVQDFFDPPDSWDISVLSFSTWSHDGIQHSPQHIILRGVESLLHPFICSLSESVGSQSRPSIYGRSSPTIASVDTYTSSNIAENIEKHTSPHILYEIEEVISSKHLESPEQVAHARSFDVSWGTISEEFDPLKAEIILARDSSYYIPSQNSDSQWFPSTLRGRPSLILRGSNFYIPTALGRINSGLRTFLDHHGISRLMSFIASSNDGIQVFMLRDILCEVGSLPHSFIHCSIASVCTRPLPSVTINVLDDGASEIDKDDFDVSFNIISREADFLETEIILEHDTPYYSSSHNLETRSHDISSFPSIEGEETNIVCIPAPVGNNVFGLQAFHDDPPDCNIYAPEAIRRHSPLRTILRRVRSLVRPFIRCLCI